MVVFAYSICLPIFMSFYLVRSRCSQTHIEVPSSHAFVERSVRHFPVGEVFLQKAALSIRLGTALRVLARPVNGGGVQGRRPVIFKYKYINKTCSTPHNERRGWGGPFVIFSFRSNVERFVRSFGSFDRSVRSIVRSERAADGPGGLKKIKKYQNLWASGLARRPHFIGL